MSPFAGDLLSIKFNKNFAGNYLERPLPFRALSPSLNFEDKFASFEE